MRLRVESTASTESGGRGSAPHSRELEGRPHSPMRDPPGHTTTSPTQREEQPTQRMRECQPTLNALADYSFLSTPLCCRTDRMGQGEVSREECGGKDPLVCLLFLVAEEEPLRVRREADEREDDSGVGSEVDSLRSSPCAIGGRSEWDERGVGCQWWLRLLMCRCCQALCQSSTTSSTTPPHS